MGFKVASRVRGLSDEAFREAFGTEEQCRTALVRLRWPDGFVCPCCGHREHCVLAGRGLYQCNRCKKQTSPTAGTIFHATKLPLTLWFAAIHLIVTAKNGISSVELGRRLGVKQPTAWAVKHKIMAVMARREGETALTGRVEMDDAYLGGVRSGGKRGRGAAGKTPFVAAVSTSPEGRPRKLKLTPVKGFRKPDMLDADRTRADQLQGADIHRLQLGTPGPAGRRAVEQLRGDALGVPLDLLRTGQRHQLALAVEQLLDAGAQHRPVTAFDREVAPQVEQGALADLLAAAFRADKAMRIIDLATVAGSGSGAPDEHRAQHRGGRKGMKPNTQNIMALHCAPEYLNPTISMAWRTSAAQSRPNPVPQR